MKLTVGEVVSDLNLIIKSATLKTTKTNKPYLFMELSDGIDTITTNVWDWDAALPVRNTVLTLKAEVTEYMGAKQLKILKMVINPTMGPTDFSPKGDMDVDAYIAQAYDLLNTVQCEEARMLANAVITDNLHLLRVIPAAKVNHHAHVAGTLKHLVDTTVKALALAEVTPCCNRDLVLIGALLHDIGKLRCYILDGVVIDFTDEGNLKDHLAIGFAMLEQYRTPTNSTMLDVVQHVVLAHHGTLDHGSPITPRCIEAIYVYLADEADARSQAIIEAAKKVPVDAKYTEKIWMLENRFMLTPNYINEVMK